MRTPRSGINAGENLGRIPLPRFVERAHEEVHVLQDVDAEQGLILRHREVQVHGDLHRPVPDEVVFTDVLGEPLLEPHEVFTRRRALSGRDGV